MEFFDFDEASFEGASHDSQGLRDDVASDCIEFDESDMAAQFDSLAQDEHFDLPNDPPREFSPGEKVEEPTHNNPTVPAPAPPLDTVTPMSMYQAMPPCDFCRHMRLDCFVANRGLMQQSCTCCTSLYRRCSFTHAKTPGKFLVTLHPVSENVDIPVGGMTDKRALKSVSGVNPVDDADGRRKKSSARFSRDTVRVLKTWLRQHSEHPYPTEQEKDQLEQQTGLTRVQICNWLANSRRRGKIKSHSSVQGAVEIPGQNPDHSLMTPMERWKHSPPENEPATRSDILRALENTRIDEDAQFSSSANHLRSRSASRKTGSSNGSSSNNCLPHMFNTPSVNSQEASQSSRSDLLFSFSNPSSLKSSSSVGNKEHRRRRRKPSQSVNAFNPQKPSNTRLFQCTFCSDSFSTKYDWQRHEKSLHLALDKWICSREGGVILENGTNICVFCKAPNPNWDHLESHNYSFCQEKTPEERTFYRKDHLNQHLRLVHEVKYNHFMERWRSSTTEVKSRCGLCGSFLSTWDERIEHLAAHFKTGADMSQWQGDWGFEPWVQKLVDNAMPPYLIDQERKTLNLSKTSNRRQLASDSSASKYEPNNANWFIILQHELTVFIQNHISTGVIPTDQMIQNQGRLVLYGSDDPGNQTCADDPIWLDTIKRNAGLEVISDPDHGQQGNLEMEPAAVVTTATTATAGWAPREPLSNNSTSFAVTATEDPARPQQSSGVPSVCSSVTGSYANSSADISAGEPLVFSTDWGSNYSTGASASSAPRDRSVDFNPFIPFDFQRGYLNLSTNSNDDNVGKEHGHDTDAMDIDHDNDDNNNDNKKEGQVGGFFSVSGTSAPITFPCSKQQEADNPASAFPKQSWPGSTKKGQNIKVPYYFGQQICSLNNT